MTSRPAEESASIGKGRQKKSGDLTSKGARKKRERGPH